MSKKTVPQAEVDALEKIATAARRFRNAGVVAIEKIRARGEREYDMSASGLDGALQALANIRGGGRYFPGVEAEPAPKKAKA